MDGIKDRATLDCCSHAFCFSCIVDWCKEQAKCRRAKCPICRHPIKEITTADGTTPAPTPEQEDGASEWTDEEHTLHLNSIREERRASRARERELLARIEAEATGGSRYVNGEVARPSPTAPTREERAQRHEQQRLDESPEQSESEQSESEPPESDQSEPDQPEQLEPPPRPPLPSLDALNWNLTSTDGTPVNLGTALACQLYDAAVAAGTLFTRTEAEARDLETTLMATVPSIKRETEAAKAEGWPIAWHQTDYKLDKLRASGIQYCASPTISCIYHEATADQDSWYEVVHFYIPSRFFESPALDQVHTALTAAANARFEFGEDESGRPISTDKAPGSVFGETDVLKRGGKSMGGKMRMYGCHRRRAAEGESVPGCAGRWPSRYGPKGARKPAIESTVHDLASALTIAEAEFSPEAAEKTTNP